MRLRRFAEGLGDVPWADVARAALIVAAALAALAVVAQWFTMATTDWSGFGD